MAPNFEDTSIAFRYRSNAALRKAQFLFQSMSSPGLTKVGTGFTSFAMKWGLPVKGLIRSTIFRQFCGGETMEEAAATAAAISKFGVQVILDYSVEGKEAEEDFDRAAQEFVAAIDFAAAHPGIPFISVKVTGFARFSLLEKIAGGGPLSTDEQREWSRVEQRTHNICARAAEKKIMVLIDAEESWIQAPVDTLALAMMQAYNRTQAIVFNTYQLYLHQRLEDLRAHYPQALQHNYILGAKLVRGAYMEKERARAAAKGYPSPVQPDKESTDRDYDAAAHFCLERLEGVSVFIGTHNEASCAKAAAWMERHDVPPAHPHVWFSQLYGMSDNISFNLAASGYHVAKYLPYGPVQDVIPYLMRRAQENTSVAGQTGRELSLIKKEMQRRRM